MGTVDDLSGLVVSPVVPVHERRAPVQEHIPQTMGNPPSLGDAPPPGNLGLGALDSIFRLLETRILGIPLWGIGVGVLVYMLIKKGQSTGAMRENEDSENYGYED